MPRANKILLIGLIMLLAGLCLPAFIKMLGDLGVFGGGWGGFGLFVIAIKLRPWLAGCGALAMLVGAFTLRRKNSN